MYYVTCYLICYVTCYEFVARGSPVVMETCALECRVGFVSAGTSTAWVVRVT